MLRRSKQSRAKNFADMARETLGPAAEQATDTLGTQVEQARKQMQPHVKKARKQMQPHVKKARKQLAPHVKQARKQLEPRVKEARKQVQPHLEEARKQVELARKQAEPYVDEAMERLAPYVEEAREQANKKWIPAAEQAAKDARERFNDDVMPAVSAAVASASAASEPYREEALRRGAATVAAVRGEVEAPKKKETHKLRNVLVLLGLGGVAFFVARKFMSEDPDSAWKSSYEPAPAPPPAAGTRPTAVPDPDSAHDAGAATPDVAIADAESSPHRPTDPDDPLENRNLS